MGLPGVSDNMLKARRKNMVEFVIFALPIESYKCIFQVSLNSIERNQPLGTKIQSSPTNCKRIVILSDGKTPQ